MKKNVTLSMEIELAWGTHDLGDFSHLSQGREQEEKYLDILLSACDEYGVPITFDIVGHLLLDECDGHSGPHDDGWFSRDPETNSEENPLFYWPEAIEKIKQSNVNHEICTHTFSHILCDRIENEVIEWELKKAESVHQQRGLDSPTSLVPPRHLSPPTDIVAKHGIRTLRGTKLPLYSKKVKKYQLRLRRWLLENGHPDLRPTKANGVLQTFTTQYPSLSAVHLPIGQRKPMAPFRAVPLEVRQRRHQQFLESTITSRDSGDFVHLWTHLSNMSNKEQWRPIKGFLTTLGEWSKSPSHNIKTMSELSGASTI